ncbi:MAG: LamG domain-containing protein, partial [Pirellula sp.]|nr:LamG domain-containing protein [Pirellula sp.]
IAPVAIVTPRRSVVSTWLPWTTAVFATVVAVIACLHPGALPRRQPTNEAVIGIASARDSIAALLVDEAHAEFAPGRGPDGVRFAPGEYELLKGVVHLRFSQGADMVLASPVRLEIVDSQHTRMTYGKVRVIAPPAAAGFTIKTPAADFVDLGTEFGLSVAPGNVASDLYVFDGQVNVVDRASGKVLSEVLEGQSSRYVDGVTRGDAPELKASEFPTPGAIGFERWQDHQHQTRRDRGLLAYFPFQRAADESVLANVLGDRDAAAGPAPHNTVAPQNRVADGRIVGARWASGRWPGKDALLFDRDSDYVQLDIPDEYQELTIAMWVKVDRLDSEFNALLNSELSDIGDVHFQLTRLGAPRGGLIGVKCEDKDLGNPLVIGRWAHVALTVSRPDLIKRCYVNGKLSRERPMLEDGTMRPGVCRIGNWLPAPGWGHSIRSLRGRIDELAIWNRALTEEEVHKLVEAGRPGLLLGEDY